jgi:hypothetical protein
MKTSTHALKHALACLIVLSSFFVQAQNQEQAISQSLNTTPIVTISISALTEYRLATNDGYTSEWIEAMKSSNPNRLLYLDYYYSKSFQIKADQNYTDEQYLLINMGKYYELRDQASSKEIYDPISKLTLILDSKNKVLEMNEAICYPNGKPAASNKYQN